MHWWIVVGIIVLAVFVCYLFWVVFEARADVRNTPKRDMFTCDKHGIFPAKWALESQILLSDNEKHLVCPMCLEDAEKLAIERLRSQPTS